MSLRHRPASRTTTRAAGASVAGLMLLGTALLATPAAADPATSWEDAAFRGSVQVVRGDDGTPEALDGVVFEDANRNSVQDADEPGIAGVTVSNGRDVVVTGEDGTYELPAFDNMTVFVTQPAGYQVPVDADNIPQIHYHHLPEGSPELEFGGLAPTGDLPDAVNFPLAAGDLTAKTDLALAVASDVQTRTLEEIEYARLGGMADLAERDDYMSGGVLLTGDVAYDDMALYPQIRELTAMLNGPAWSLPGNHDMDFDATTRIHAFDTYRAQIGPQYYSFDTGDVHVVMLNNIEYPLNPDNRRYGYSLDENQLEWLRQDLAQVPSDTLVVVASHAPLLEFYYQNSHRMQDLPEIYALLEGRPAYSVSGHAHMAENLHTGDLLAGWTDITGEAGLPFPHLVAPTVSGQWYNGRLTEAGYPTSIQRDGTPPGIVTLDVSGTTITERFTRTGGTDDEQMALGINSPQYRIWFDANRANRGNAPQIDTLTVPTGDLGETWLTTNFWMGATGSTVEVSLDGATPVAAERTQTLRGDTPNIGAQWTDPVATQEQFVHGGGLHDRTSHLWRFALPADLAVGEHTATVTATDVHGRSFTETLIFDVIEGPATFTRDGIPVTAEIPEIGGDDGTRPGTLALSVTEGAATLTDARNAGDRLRLTGTLPQVSVTDSRTDAAGWNLTGTATARTDDDATITADHLGWAPYLLTGDAKPGAAIKTLLAGGPGLATPATLGTSTGGTGTDTLAADLQLHTPIDTEAGTYTGAITVSLFPTD